MRTGLNSNTKTNNVYVTSDEELFNNENVERNSKGRAEEPATFETAIEATNFGKYNWMLLMIGIPAALSSQFDTTSTAYILPIAQCDLNLSIDDKGLLNAITYMGMVSGAFIWGYLADTIGRRKLLICGYFLDGFFATLGGFSMHYTMLVVTKFMAGFIITGPFAALISYLSEFHCAKYRAPIPLLIGTVHSIGSILLPLLGWVTFTEKINLTIFDSFLVLRSWNVYLIICALPSLIAGISFLFLPESPKFLMTTGKNEEAYKVFQNMYSWNTGKPKDTYPIKALVDEISLQDTDENKHKGRVTANRTKIQALKEGWQQIVPLFRPPYVDKMIVVFVTQFTLVMGLNSFRLWLPQIFTAINDYYTFDSNAKGVNMCDMIERINPNKTEIEDLCFVNYDNSAVYINNIISSSMIVAMNMISMATVNKLGKKPSLITTGLTAGVCGLCIYFAKNEAAVVVLSSLFLGLSAIACNLILSVVVDLFPTTLRTMTITVALTSGRSGAVVGNLIFPTMIASGCLTPFLTIGVLTFGGTLLTAFLPKTDMKALE